jgi:guanylate kinase
MSYIVIVFGASGSGKTMLMEQLMLAGGQYSIHIKTTNRPPRQYDDIEIQCVASVNPTEYDYIYSTYGYSYGIQRIQIEKSVDHNRHHFIICNDISVIRAIKRDYGSRVKVVFHYFDAPRSTLLSIQQARGISDDEIELRLAKTESLYKTYAENWNLFDAVLPNHFGEEPPDLRSKMEALLEQWARRDQESPSPALLLKRLETFAADIETRLTGKWPSKTSAVEPGYAFIIMAMPKDDFWTQDVHRTIKRACRDFGLKAERVDDIQFTGQITQKIKSSIGLAEFVIADLTHGRPNVYYEVGFADAFDKPLLLVAKEGTEIHFDLAGDKVLFYRNIAELEDLLTRALKNIRNEKGAA